MPEHILAIDLGTSSTKVAIVNASGQILAGGEAAYPINRPRERHVEQNPNDWWSSIRKAVRHAASQVSTEKLHIAVIGITGQMHGTVLLTREERLVSPAVIWLDQRSHRQADEITELIGLAELVRITGSSAFTGFQASTIRWFQQEKPEVWSRVNWVMAPKDWLRWRLTGEIYSDPSDASGTSLFDINQRHWSEKILRKLDIDPRLLPPLLESTAAAGYLQKEAAEDLGISAGVPVITGAADTACSILGAGIKDASDLLITISSGGQIVSTIDQVQVDTAGRIHTFCSALKPGDGQSGWYMLAALLTAGLAFRWLKDDVLGLTGEQAYHQMTGWAAASPPGARGTLFLPYLTGERTPHMDPDARGVLIGLTASHDRADIIRAVMEGVAFAFRDAYSCLLDLGVNPRTITLAGGGVRVGAGSGLWQQIFADVFGSPVRRLKTENQSAVGAAMLAGAGSQLIDIGTSLRSWPDYGKPVEPIRENRDIYQERFTIFRNVYRQNRELLHSLSAAANTKNNGLR